MGQDMVKIIFPLCCAAGNSGFWQMGGMLPSTPPNASETGTRA